MSDVETGGSKWQAALEKMDTKPFFSFSKPYLDLIGKRKIYNLVYFIMAAINLILPFVTIFSTIESGSFSYGGARFIFAIILSWFVIIFACWIGFQLWWNRRTRIANIAPSEFIVTLIFSEILQTFGEWLGTLIGIIGAGVGLIAFIFLNGGSDGILSLINMGFLNFGALTIIIGPVIGFCIVILFRFFAEQLRLFATLANNTKEIATHLKK